MSDNIKSQNHPREFSDKYSNPDASLCNSQHSIHNDMIMWNRVNPTSDSKFQSHSYPGKPERTQ